MADSPPPSLQGESLEWLSTEKLLELIAHDINNMCHGALSFIDLAMDPKQAPEARAKYLQTARQLTHRASRFTPHLKALYELRAADVAALSSEPLSKAAAEAKVHAQDLNQGAALDVEKTGDGWERRVKGGKFVTSALAHLFDNAIRFQRPGGKAKVTADAQAQGGFVVMVVADNGKGFPKGSESYAARRFSQSGSVSGAGLGLAFVRILAERAGGSFEIVPGHGNEPGSVRLRLPEASAP
jgi:signal transduction histidine kinase